MTETTPHQPTGAAFLAEELRSFARRLRRRLRTEGAAGGLSQSEVPVLIRLEKEGPMTISALARAEGMRPQSMGGLVRSLDEAGLVGGTPDPSDGRQTLIAITDQCRDILRQRRAARQDWLARAVEAELSPDERRQVEAVLPLLNRLADHP